jgi:hypothetical protein
MPAFWLCALLLIAESCIGADPPYSAPADPHLSDDVHRKVLAENFDAWDTNSDGKLSGEEIKARLAASSDEDKDMFSSEDSLQTHFDYHADKDGDGFVDHDKIDEYKKRDKKIDANEDGQISYDEYRSFRLEQMTQGYANRVESMSAKVPNQTFLSLSLSLSRLPPLASSLTSSRLLPHLSPPPSLSFPLTLIPRHSHSPSLSFPRSLIPLTLIPLSLWRRWTRPRRGESCPSQRTPS